MPPRRSFRALDPVSRKSQAARLNETVHLVQQFRQPLDLVNHDDSVFRAKLLSHAPRILTESQDRRSVQEIVDTRAAQCVLNEKCLARLSRPQQKVGFFLQKGRQIQYAFDHLTAFGLRIIRRHNRQIS